MDSLDRILKSQNGSRGIQRCRLLPDWTNADQFTILCSMVISPQMDRIELLMVKLKILKRDHRDLDAAIHALHEKGRGDLLMLQRLKRQKLAVKDDIRRLEDEIIPDIIA